jgi:nucleoside-diphosphate-sugar epimerase
MQVILGAGGTIARGIARLLPQHTDKIRLVSRNPKKVNEGDELFQADLKDLNAVMNAIKGADVVYLTAGLKYDIKVWEADWPVIIKNALAACKWANAKLVFFDNVYALGKVDGWMKESTPMNPVSKKGEVRKQLSGLILEAVSKGNVNAIIARAADFYGPDSPFSVVNMLLLDKFAKGKSGQMLISDKYKHTYTYTPDAAQATVLLGNNPAAYNRIWHLPTDKNALTGKEFAELAARIYGVPPKYSVIPKFMIRILGLFKTELRELVEMSYQNDSDYLFSSSEFEKTFDFIPTTYQKGLEETLKSMKQ